MKYRIAFLLASALACLTLAPTEGSAQVASSFEQLQVLVRTGDTVSVTEVDGKVTKGKVDQISPSYLRLLQGRMPVELLDANVIEIKRKDSIANGTKMGATVGGGVGAGLGILIAAATCGDWSCTPESVGGIALFAGLSAGVGAVIGASIDAVINRNPIVYRAPARVTMSPVLSGGRKGIRLSISF